AFVGAHVLGHAFADYDFVQRLANGLAVNLSALLLEPPLGEPFAAREQFNVVDLSGYLGLLDPAHLDKAPAAAAFLAPFYGLVDTDVDFPAAEVTPLPVL